MTYFGLNSEYVDAKGIERLCSSYQEENIKASADLAVVSATTDLKQMPAIGVSVVSADLDLTLKEVLRNTHWNVDHPVRKALWKFLFKRVSTDDDDIDLYHEMVKDLFGESYHPSSLPSFVDPAYCIRYHLNAEGRKNVEKILHVIRHIKPDITYCPILYPLTSLLLHYMSDGMAFACIMKLLNDKQNYMSQTKADHTASAYLVMKLTKKYARNAYNQLEKELKEHEDLESMFQNWLSWIFKGLPFPYVVRVMDCFLVEKKKCLYRIVLALLILYSKNSDKSANEDLGMMQKLLDYFQNITVPIDKIFKIAYGIRGFSERVVNQQLVKVQMTLKSHTNLSERSMSADRLSPTNPVYHVDMDSASQLVVRELKMDASSRARSVGVVALGNFKSGIISAEQMSLIWSWLPIRISMYQPEVIYSSNEHGVCLTAFYMAAGKWEPTVLVIKSMNDEDTNTLQYGSNNMNTLAIKKGNRPFYLVQLPNFFKRDHNHSCVFGAYCSSSWNSRNSTDVNNKKYTYFGTGECFLFTLVPEAKRYPWVGCSSDNVPHSAKLFMAADSNMINVGAGNGQGLVLFDNLYHGRTEHCDTFDNEPLCSVKDFQCKVVEVICFK